MLDIIGLFTKSEQKLFVLNMALQESGFPFYYFGKKNLVPQFNEAYRLAPEPSVRPQWFPPFVKITEVYLSFFENDRQVDLVYDPQKREIVKITPKTND